MFPYLAKSPPHLSSIFLFLDHQSTATISHVVALLVDNRHPPISFNVAMWSKAPSPSSDRLHLLQGKAPRAIEISLIYQIHIVIVSYLQYWRAPRLHYNWQQPTRGRVSIFFVFNQIGVTSICRAHTLPGQQQEKTLILSQPTQMCGISLIYAPH